MPSFSASTCLSYTGTTTLTDPIRIFSNLNDITPFTSVTLIQITSCPLVLTGIPDGTTTIRLKSADNYCCDIVLTCNDLCTTCDLAFDVYSTNLISRLVAGNLTGSCDNFISDYKIKAGVSKKHLALKLLKKKGFDASIIADAEYLYEKLQGFDTQKKDGKEKEKEKECVIEDVVVEKVVVNDKEKEKLINVENIDIVLDTKTI